MSEERRVPRQTTREWFVSHLLRRSDASLKTISDQHEQARLEAEWQRVRIIDEGGWRG